MIKTAAMPPFKRAQAVKDWRAELAYERQAKLAAWDLEASLDAIEVPAGIDLGQVNSRMVQVEARVLSPPKVLYKGSTAMPSQGSWDIRRRQVSEDTALCYEATTQGIVLPKRHSTADVLDCRQFRTFPTMSRTCSGTSRRWSGI